MSDVIFWVGMFAWTFWAAFEIVERNGAGEQKKKSKDSDVEPIEVRRDNHFGRGSFGFSDAMRVRMAACAWD